MKEQWKKQMQQKMADYRESDIEVSWAEIEKALAANRKQAKVVPLWTKRIAAAAVILLIVGGGYWTVFHQQTGTGKQAGQPQLASVSQQEPQVSQEPDEMLEQEERITQAIQRVRAQGVLSLFTAEKEAEPKALEAPDAPTEAETEAPAAEDVAPADTMYFPKYTPTHTRQQHTVYPSELRKRTASYSRLTAKVYLSNTMASSSSYSVYDLTQQSPQQNVPKDADPTGKTAVSGNVGEDGTTSFDGKGNQSDKGDKGDKGDQGNQGDQGDQSNQGDQGNQADQGDSGTDGTDGNVIPVYETIHTSERVHHHQPIRFGFSLRYRLNERWGIESGLTYTRLNADITNTVDGQTTATEQRLNYIGIPLNVSYLMWGNRHFNFYLSAGGLVEKMVKGSRTTQGYTSSVRMRPLQFSVNGAAGAEFKFTESLSIYAEPSLNYYFDNGSNLPTLYQEKPLNFNLNLGLRFNLK
jgi:hypothetical protein